jgi:hypothetical protein
MKIEDFFGRFGPKFAKAIQLFDEANSHDPHLEVDAEKSRPKELVYAERLTEWVLNLDQNPPEKVLLASRCQHLCRWEIPRSSYELTKPGYLKWRSDLKKFHAEKAGQILLNAGYSRETISDVQALLLKQNLKSDPAMQLVEDALCLVFLQYQFAELAGRTSEEKMVNALKKSWNKMSPRAHEHALRLPYSDFEMNLIKKALAA